MSFLLDLNTCKNEIMLQHFHTINVSNLDILKKKKQIRIQGTEMLQKFKKTLKIIYENFKEAIVNIIKENSVTRVNFGRKKFNKLTFDFYTHGTYCCNTL